MNVTASAKIYDYFFKPDFSTKETWKRNAPAKILRIWKLL